MDIEQIIQQASWRIRAWLAARQTDPARVGWRHDDTCCPLAEWLVFEIIRSTGMFPAVTISVDADEIIVGPQVLATPPMLSTFIDLIDGAVLAPDAWMAQDARVSRQETEAALVEAEKRATCLLLPLQAQSVPRCSYIDPFGRRCQMPASTPVVHGFFQRERSEPGRPEYLCRENCVPFFGGVCCRHWLQVVVPPASWWPREAGVEPKCQAVLA